MVIPLKSWNIVVKLFTTFVSEYSWGILEKILGIVPRKFPGFGSEDLFATNFLWFFWRISNKKFPRIGYKKFLG